MIQILKFLGTFFLIFVLSNFITKPAFCVKRHKSKNASKTAPKNIPSTPLPDISFSSSNADESLHVSEEAVPDTDETPLKASTTPAQDVSEILEKESSTLTEKIVAPVKEKTPQEALVSKPFSAVKTKIKKDALTLKEALEGAYAQSPLLSAEYQVKAAQMSLTGAKRDWLPKTTASVGYTKNSAHSVLSRGATSAGLRSDSNGNSQTGTTQGSFAIQQNLYSGGATTANISAQKKVLDATVASYMVSVRDTLFSAIKSFIDLSTKQEVFRLNKGSQALLEHQLTVATNRYEFGELTRYDVAATQAKLDKAKAEVIAALSDAEIAKATFVKVTGIVVDSALEKPKDPSHLIPSSKADAIQIALKLSPELHKQESLADAAKAETDKTFGGLLPSFDVNASATRRLTDNWDKKSYFEGHGSTRREELEAAATLSIPLDFRGSTQSSIRQQKYVAAQKRLTAIYERRNVMEKVSQYWDSLESARARIKQIESQVTASKIALETVNEEFLAGNKTTLDVLTAEQELSSAQVDLVKAEQSVILNAYQLLATIGQLDAQNLELDVSIYSPEKDYENISFWGVNITQDNRIQSQEVSNYLMKGSEATR